MIPLKMEKISHSKVKSRTIRPGEIIIKTHVCTSFALVMVFYIIVFDPKAHGSMIGDIRLKIEAEVSSERGFIPEGHFRTSGF